MSEDVRRTNEAKLRKRQNRVLAVVLKRWEGPNQSRTDYHSLAPSDIRRIAVDLIMRAEDGHRI